MPARTSPPRLPDLGEAARVIRAEYREMPGLCLSLEQAARLWSLERPQCEAVLSLLTREGFLRRTPNGYSRAA